MEVLELREVIMSIFKLKTSIRKGPNVKIKGQNVRVRW